MLMKGPAQAMEGPLNIIAGGAEPDIERVKPVLMTFTDQFFHVGFRFFDARHVPQSNLNVPLGVLTRATLSEIHKIGW